MKRLFLVVAAITVLAGCAVPTTQTTPATTQEESATGVTMTKFEQVQPGMTLEEVEAILGPGTEISRVEIEGVPTTVMYQWEGQAFASNMNAQFQNDKLTTKAQFGLE